MNNIVPIELLPTPDFQSKSAIGTDDTVADIIVAGGSEIEHITFFGIGRKQIGQPSFGGGSLNSASSYSSVARRLHKYFFMLRPMIPLSIGVTILDEHTRLTCLETNPSSPQSAQQALIQIALDATHTASCQAGRVSRMQPRCYHAYG